MLLTEKVIVRWHNNTKSHYMSKGYEFTKIGDEFEVKVEDLPNGSHAKVSVKCDDCNKILKMEYKNYLYNVREDGSYYCKKCASECRIKNMIKTKLKNGKTFGQWCLDNDREDILDRWDYKLNGCKPSEIGYGVNGKYWFKCNKHPEHHSELKRINSFTSGQEGSMNCIQCNSIMQWCIDNELVEHLNIEKNLEEGLDLWSISYGSTKKIWFKCLEKDYHNDFGGYQMTCCGFINGHRCSYCRKFKVHPKDSVGQYIIDNYGEKFLNKVWSDKNDISPFEVSCGSKRNIWWKCYNNKHKNYQRTVEKSTRCKFRCPECYEPPKGENHPSWNPDLTSKDRENNRNYLEYDNFIKTVMKRDNYLCQITGRISKSDLVVHHLNGYNWDKDNRTNPDNAITLCKSIHKLFHRLYGYGNNTEEQFENFLMKIECGEIDLDKELDTK